MSNEEQLDLQIVLPDSYLQAMTQFTEAVNQAVATFQNVAHRLIWFINSSMPTIRKILRCQSRITHEYQPRKKIRKYLAARAAIGWDEPIVYRKGRLIPAPPPAAPPDDTPPER